MLYLLKTTDTFKSVIVLVYFFLGFNPVWEETITFILTFPDLAIFRFVVWDEDPIGRDFIGQVTFPFSSLVQGTMVVVNRNKKLFTHGKWYCFKYSSQSTRIRCLQLTLPTKNTLNILCLCLFLYLFVYLFVCLLIKGYRHVHLEGDQQASIFVHVTIADYNCEKVTIELFKNVDSRVQIKEQKNY